MPETEQITVQNLDIRWLIDHIDRMRMEVGYSQSSAWPSGLFEADRLRIIDFISDLGRAMEYAISLPTPDSPEAHGRYEVRIPGVYEPQGPDGKAPRSPEEVENDDLANLLRQLEVYRMELVNAQSVKLIQGFIQTPSGQPSDVVRMREGLQRLTNLVTHIGETQPSDRPESTPREVPVPPGR